MVHGILMPSGRTEPPIPLPLLMVTPPKKFGLTVNQVLGRLFARQQPKPLDELVEELFDSLHQEPCWSADPLLLRLRDGVDYFTEEQADDYLKENRGTTTRDWLTKEQLALRIAKEVLNENGVPDSRLMSGMYKRVYNPNAGQRPSKGRRSNDE
jgi:hypothetical protein